ncbi:MAG: Ig-like domain-containing protein, partial [Undibacterium sp.]|nr:Ig-like domain-containing protein [Undibacterium sp.]
TVSFPYVITDGTLTSTANQVITVTPVNDAPIAVADNYTMAEDGTAITLTPLTGDSDPDGTAPTILSINGTALTPGVAQTILVTGGTVNITAGNVISFTPNANFNGTVSFPYVITDGTLTSTANQVIQVTPVNDLPVNTVPAAQSTVEDTAKVFSAANGNALSVADPDGGSLSTTVSVAHGALTAVAFAGAVISNNGTGTITITGTAAAINGALNGLSFAPTADYNGSDTLTITTNDGTVSDIDTVAITVTPAIDIANDGVITTNEDTLANINVNANDSFENAGHTITAINGTAIAVNGSVAVINGSVTLKADGTLDFTPTANFNGVVPTFTYTVTSGGVTETANVNVTVKAVNDAPSGIDRTVTTGEDIPYHFSTADFLMNDVEDGNNVISAAVRIDTLPANGTLQLNGATVAVGQVLTVADVGNLVFTPAANASASSYASFTFSVRDSGGSFDPAPNILTISVSPMVDLSLKDVQHWTFNEGSGSNTTNIYPTPDQLGIRTDGIAGGTNRSPTFTASGHEGAGMFFNGVWSNTSSARDGGYVALPTTVTDPLRGDGAGGGNASLVFWINTTQTGGTIGWNSPSVIGMENNGGTIDVQWGWISSTGRIGFGMADDAGIMSTNPINDGGWHSVAITHNFTNGATEVWVDGVLNSTGTLQAGKTVPNKFLGFGVTADDGAATDRYLNGTLDDVRIYDRVLTATHIQAIYAVESNNLGANAVIDNDGGSLRFNVVANDYAQMTITGAPVGATFIDGTHSVLVTTVDQIVDVTGWTQSELAVTGMGTNSAMLAVTATGVTAGDSVTQYLNIVTGSTVFNGTAAANTMTGTAGSDFLSGLAGDDTINAGTGADRIMGGLGNDTINAGADSDVIIGGAGSDILTGGLGADTFRWELADRGAVGSAPIDRITDFDTAAFSASGDRLDLRDLLQGENYTTGTGNLGSYLHFVKVGSDTEIHISSTGAYSSGFNAANDDQVIKLTGVDLT